MLFHSDDWGRVGVQDAEGFAALRASGVYLGGHPYDFYTLETADDVRAICRVLSRHRDASGRSPILGMNFVLANVDFPATAETRFERLCLRPLTEGLPGKWKRPGLLDAYREGIEAGVFYPAFHGVTHFCKPVVERYLRSGDERGQLLRTLYRVETPYIYHHMPWVGYEYWDASCAAGPTFLKTETQHRLIAEGVNAFRQLFGNGPVSACAPGYRANEDTHRAWSACGIKVVQTGPDNQVGLHINRVGLLQIQRNVEYEPALDPSRYTVEAALVQTARAFTRGLPAVVSLHSINFHSSLKDFRALTLKRLDQFLSALEGKHKNVLYLHDGDLYELVRTGGYTFGETAVEVPVKRRWMPVPGLLQTVRARMGKLARALHLN